MNCSNCNAPIPEGSQFCAACGSSIVSPSPAPSVPDVSVIPEVSQPIPVAPEAITPPTYAAPEQQPAPLPNVPQMPGYPQYAPMDMPKKKGGFVIGIVIAAVLVVGIVAAALLFVLPKFLKSDNAITAMAKASEELSKVSSFEYKLTAAEVEANGALVLGKDLTDSTFTFSTSATDMGINIYKGNVLISFLGMTSKEEFISMMNESIAEQIDGEFDINKLVQNNHWNVDEFEKLGNAYIEAMATEDYNADAANAVMTGYFEKLMKNKKAYAEVFDEEITKTSDGKTYKISVKMEALISSMTDYLDKGKWTAEQQETVDGIKSLIEYSEDIDFNGMSVSVALTVDEKGRMTGLSIEVEGEEYKLTIDKYDAATVDTKALDEMLENAISSGYDDYDYDDYDDYDFDYDDYDDYDFNLDDYDIPDYTIDENGNLVF